MSKIRVNFYITKKYKPIAINSKAKKLNFVIVSLNTYLPIKVVQIYVSALHGKTIVRGRYFKRSMFNKAPNP